MREDNNDVIFRRFYASKTTNKLINHGYTRKRLVRKTLQGFW